MDMSGKMLAGLKDFLSLLDRKSALPEPKSGSANILDKSDVLEDEVKKSGSANILDESDVLEDEVKPKASQVADISKPEPKKSRQPVKITIPALPDSDDEEGPARKKTRLAPSAGKSGLTSLLPAPVHGAKKETNRLLLPYTLTKKSQPSTPKPLQSKSQSTGTVGKASNVTTSLASYGSDSDEDEEEDSQQSINFFSIDSGTKHTGTNSHVEPVVGPTLPPFSQTSGPAEPSVVARPGLIRSSLHLPAPVHQISNSVNHLSNSESVSRQILSADIDAEVISEDIDSANGSLADLAGIAGAVRADAPLVFRGGVTSRNPSIPLSAGPVGPMLPSMSMNEGYDVGYGAGSYPEAEDVESYEQDQEFLRLQGKQKRGREEINIIDVNADDFTDPSEITKHLTEEQSYQSHRKKDDQPSSQQRRKHQIGYLAFQAKERELELKNQWSQNKMTRKQTQAKYGF
ncbi:hypothetical protein DPMN_106588 [Dreissena polymorpha]|uniref:Proline-rich protein PRCC n=1 Tax=Dreissena polymorpha TaxID=45954 RepID=A0A9D4QK57_DREPO|nr:hypothetical protein DPMN_106588 [Dreissena polymorpha]